ncbi:hypothetical protein D3C74_386510 [compost metagenome]
MKLFCVFSSFIRQVETGIMSFMNIITTQQRAEAEDMGYNICETCGVSYVPAPGFFNDGHQCEDDGTQDKCMTSASE